VNTGSSNWGDEVEYLVFRLNHEAREVHLSLRGSQILSDLKQRFPEELFDLEACKYMLESQPRRPYGNSLRDLAVVESNMRERWVNIDPW
jgi:glutamate--cysteine ligase catalytic subunit